MFIILLRFSDNKSEAGRFMAAHQAWIARGFADGVFLLVGGLQPAAGGAILAQGPTRAALEDLVNADPFVANGVVRAEILEIAPRQADDRLAFLVH